MIIIYSVLTLFLLGLLFGIALALASRLLKVKEDPRQQKVLSALPGSNCGACGFAGCSNYAEAIVLDHAKITLCLPGGECVVKDIAEVMGVPTGKIEKKYAVIHCCGGGIGKKKYNYAGVRDCRVINMVAGGSSECDYGCLMGYACLDSCPVDAIVKNEHGMPYVIPEKCIGCGRCVSTCPRNLIEIIPEKSKIHILCLSKDRGANVRKICSVGCIGCGKCVKECPFDAIKLVDNLAVIDYSKCKVCSKCVSVCPVNVIYNWRKEFIIPGFNKSSIKSSM